MAGETKMRPPVLLVVTLAVVGVLAALPLGQGSPSWPCCDDCGVCNQKQPPECQCNDVSVHGCHPECKSCVKLGTVPPGFGLGPVVTYRCADMVTNFCQSNCTAAPASVLLGGGGV